MNARWAGRSTSCATSPRRPIPQIKAGNVKFYGVTTKNRIKAMPDAPTLNERD